jgi:NAD(P)-dependent dehydrogenase (short-subunit alcohol dehydrogenase family)
MDMASHAASLSGRHALVTGAGTGIGAAIAASLARAGARVSLAGRRREPLVAVAEQLSGSDTLVVAGFDVTDPAKVADGVAQTRGKFGPVDILINNAGEAPSAPFAKTDLAQWNRALAVNLTGTYLVTKEVLPDMLARQSGRIVNVASTAGLIGYARLSAYTAAKHGVVGLTRALALEVAKTGVTVNAVCPGYTDTDMIGNAVEAIARKSGGSRADALKTFTDVNPQGRLVSVEEVASTVLWLVSDGASAINGQAIAIAGGEVMTG